MRSDSPRVAPRPPAYRPTLIDRYLLREIASPFLIALALLTFVLLIPHLADISDLLVAKNATWDVIARLLWTILPSFLALTIPMAFLLAVLLGLGRLAGESELIAMRAVGVSPHFLLRPITLLALACSGATYYVHAFWVPDSNQRYRETAFSLAISRAQSVRPRVFIDDVLPNRSIWVKDVDPSSGEWKDALIYDRSDPMKPRVWLARSGALRVNRAERRVELELAQGSAYAFDLTTRKTFEIQRFGTGRFPVDFSQLFPELPLSRGDREMTPDMLREQIAKFEREGNPGLAARYAVEYHKMDSLAFVPIVFGVIGLGLMLTGRRDSRGSAFGLAIQVVFAYYVLARLGEQAGDTRALPPAAAVWAPNLILMAVAAWLFWRARNDGATDPFDWSRLRDALRRRTSPHAADASRAGEPGLIASFVSVLDRYVGRAFVRHLTLITASLLAIPILLEFMDLLDDVQTNRVKGLTLVSYFVYNTPFYLFAQILPMAILVATLATYGILARGNEITAMKATGISVYRAAVPALAIALFTSVVMFFGNDFFVPETKRRASREFDVIKGRPPRSNTALDRRMALGENDGRFYAYDSITPSAAAGSVMFRGLSVVDVDTRTWTLREHLQTDSVRWDGRVYEMTGGFRRSFREEGVRDEPIGTIHTGEIDPPTHFSREERTADELSFAQLSAHIRSLEDVGLDGTPLRVGLHRKIAYPAMCLVMAFVALPFSFIVGRRGALFGVGVALSFAVVYQACFAFFEALGKHGQLPAALAAWAPNLIFVAAGTYFFLSLDT